MLKEINYDITTWWNEQSFQGKDLFKITELGALSLNAFHFLKERNIAYLSLDTADVVLKNLQEKFFALEAKMREIEIEWLATEDKLKLADKIDHLKDWMQHLNAVGNFEKQVKIILDWENAIQVLSKENYDAKMQLVELAESLIESRNWKESAQTFRDIADKWKLTGHINRNNNDKLYNRIESARKKFQDRKRHFLEEEEKDMINNLDLKIEIAETAEALVNSEEWKNTTEAFYKLMDKWKTIGRTPGKKNEELWQRLQTARNTFFDRKKIHFNDIQQEQEANYALKLPLVEKAEALKDSTDWSNTTQAFSAIMDEWKKIGKVQFERSEEIWKRLTDAADHFYEAKKQHTGQIRQEQDNNYKLKMELLQRAERLKHSFQFHDATLEFTELMEEWKKIGFVPKEHTNTIWEAFNEARKFFFTRKDEDREQRKKQFEARNAARIEDAKNRIKQIREDLKEEEQKLVDFTEAIQNITPGKKAAELKAHLETLIKETTARIKQLKDKQKMAGEDAPATEKNEAEKV